MKYCLRQYWLRFSLSEVDNVQIIQLFVVSKQTLNQLPVGKNIAKSDKSLIFPLL